MSRPSRSVYTVTRSTFLTADEEMSDIAYIDVDDDDDYSDTDFNSASTSAKPRSGNLYEAKSQVTDQQRDLSERGVFDYFSSPLTLNRGSAAGHVQETRVPNHCYLGPGGSASVPSSGVRKFVEAHRQADRTGSSDEEMRSSGYETRWSPSSYHSRGVDGSPPLDSQWVRDQYNQHVQQTNTQCYDEAVPCDDTENFPKDRRLLSTDSKKPADFVNYVSFRPGDDEPIVYRHPCGDAKRDICDTDFYRDPAAVSGDTADITCRADKSSSPVSQSLTLQSAGRNSKDICDSAAHRSSSGHAWPASARSSDSYGSGLASGLHQNAVCRSSELPTVVNAVGSVRCSTGVDTGVGFPLSTVSSSSRSMHGLSSSAQGTRSCGLEQSHWSAVSSGQPSVTDYSETLGSRHHIGRSQKYEQVMRKGSQDSDEPFYSHRSRGNDSDGDDSVSGSRRNDPDITSNVDILHRGMRSRDYETGSSGRAFISTPQYHLMPTEEEETERRQSAKGQQLERMRYRRNARLNRQSAGVSTADTVPGFRGEATVEELMSYIDAPPGTVADSKTARKQRKKKKKMSAIDSSEVTPSGAVGQDQSDVAVTDDGKLSNSCEVFVGSSTVSTDEPSVRVGDSCCIELRKKSDCDSLSGIEHTLVDANGNTMDSHASICPAESATAEGAESTFCSKVVHSQNEGTDAEVSCQSADLPKDLPEVVYTEMQSVVIDDDSISAEFTESAVGAETADETTFVARSDAANGDSLGFSDEKTLTAVDVDRVSVESGEATMKMTESASSLATESSCENIAGASASGFTDRQHESSSSFASLTGQDSVASDGGSVDDSFVTVQKKKRSKNTAVPASEDFRQKFGRRPGGKAVEDNRDSGSYVKRSWVKSSDISCAVPSVSRNSIIYCKPSWSVVSRPDAARYSQASNGDVNVSSASGEKCCKPVSLAESASKCIAGQNGSAVSHTRTLSPRGIATDRAESRNEVTELEKDGRSKSEKSVTTVVLPTSAVTSVRKPTSDPEDICDCNTAAEPCTSSSEPLSTVGDASTTTKNQPPASNADAGKKLHESSAETEIHLESNCEAACESRTATSGGAKTKLRSSELSAHNADASDVFLDTRNIAGTTPPRSDITFGFDPGSLAPEPSADTYVRQEVSQSDEVVAAVVSSCHRPVVPPLAPAVAGCGAPLIYFYPAMPVTILPPVAAFSTGRCTPVGVVPPMPVADMSSASAAWTPPTDDKVISVPVSEDGQNTAISSVSVESDAAEPSSSAVGNSKSQFVLSAAQRFLYAEFEKVLESSRTSLPSECLVVHYSSIEGVLDH